MGLILTTCGFNTGLVVGVILKSTWILGWVGVYQAGPIAGGMFAAAQGAGIVAGSYMATAQAIAMVPVAATTFGSSIVWTGIICGGMCCRAIHKILSKKVL